MANVFDVAKYILHQKGEMTAMKLQKLVYYSQAWSLVWDEKSLFPERIEAWATGPVVPDLYQAHKGAFIVNEAFFEGNIDNLSTGEKETIDAVLGTYADHPAQWLSELSHNEDPWKNAREGLQVGTRSNREITHSAMVEYYESLL